MFTFKRFVSKIQFAACAVDQIMCEITGYLTYMVGHPKRPIIGPCEHCHAVSLRRLLRKKRGEITAYIARLDDPLRHDDRLF